MIEWYFTLNTWKKIRVIAAVLVFNYFFHFYMHSSSLSSPGLYVIPISLVALGFPGIISWPIIPLLAVLAIYRDFLINPNFVTPERFIPIVVAFSLAYFISCQFRNTYLNITHLNWLLETQKKEMEQTHKHIIMGLVNAIDAKDKYLEGHSRNVAFYAEQISLALGLSEMEIRDINYSALLHDIGKIGISETILNKENLLSETEWKTIKTHPVIGAKIVKNIPNCRKVSENIFYHHKYYDGTGYPDVDISGQDIPLGARIIAVADAFDAMTSRRSYRYAMSSDRACEELLKCKGTQFDPQVIEAFLKFLSQREQEALP
ncbi:MAG: HD-GYP domain-containing protein [Bacillota bacterium]